MPASSRLLIQVVPRLNPMRCGVSDNAIALAEELGSCFGIESAFVVLNSNEQCDLPIPRIHCKPHELLDACLSLTGRKPGSILLQYSGYGFAPDGAPGDLADALKLVRQSEQFRIGTYFHELFATAMPWRSAFWYSHRQKEVARRISSVCDLVATNVSRHSEWLEREAMQGAANSPLRIPVFSNIGESAELPPFKNRVARMVVFGLAATRNKSYRSLVNLGGLLKALGVEEILDIGPEFDAPKKLDGIPVRAMGVVAPSELATIFSHSLFGFVQHPSVALAKSGILAGLSATGTIPVVARSFPQEVDGLVDGVHLLSPQTAKRGLAKGLENCSAAIWRWYWGHRLNVHAGTYSRLLVQRNT